MKDCKTKKELQEQYRERKVTGGVYVIVNTQENKMLLDVTTDFQGSKNRFDFSKKTGSCVYLKLQSDWTKYGGDAFAYEVLEELDKGENQSMEEFKADIDLLKEMWLEKLTDKNLY